MNIIIITIGIVAILVLIGQGVWFGYKMIKDKIKIKNELVIYGDVKTSLKEGVIFYIIDNLRSHEEIWDSDLDNFRLYMSGREVSCRAFKSNDIPNGIRVAVVGIMNSSTDVIHLAGAIRYNFFEVSFDGGATTMMVNGGRIDKSQYKAARAYFDSISNHSTIQGINDIKRDKTKSEKTTIAPGSLPQHGLLAHINEGKTTGTSMRYQIVIPQEHPILELVGDNVYSGSFYHIYEGHAYKLDSRFVEHTGSLYEFDIINLEPGKIYVGLSTSIDGGKNVLPSSALYGITKDKRGNLPQLDDAELAKPAPGAKPYKMWGEDVLTTYVGPQYAKRMYDVIVKKHYEDEYADKYISLSRSQDFYDDYAWLTGGVDSNSEESIHIARKIARVQDEHGAVDKDVKDYDHY